MRQSTSKQFACCAALISLFAASSAIAQNISIDEVSGTVARVGRTTLTVDAAGGALRVELVGPNGRTPETAVEVAGTDTVQMLATHLFARVVAEVDESGQPVGIIREIRVSDVLFGEFGVVADDLDAEFQFPELGKMKEPTAAEPPAAGLTRHTFTGLIVSVNETDSVVTLALDDRRRNRVAFQFDPDTTKVRFRLHTIGAAEIGDFVQVRGFEIDESELVALEVRIQRMSPFPDDAPIAEIAAADDAGETEAETGVATTGAAIEMAEGVPVDADPEMDALVEAVPSLDNAEITRFDFDDFPGPERPVDPAVKARQWFKIN